MAALFNQVKAITKNRSMVPQFHPKVKRIRLERLAVVEILTRRNLGAV